MVLQLKDAQIVVLSHCAGYTILLVLYWRDE